MKHRLLQVLGWALATVFVPLAWDRHDTYWPWLVFTPAWKVRSSPAPVSSRAPRRVGAPPRSGAARPRRVGGARDHGRLRLRVHHRVGPKFWRDAGFVTPVAGVVMVAKARVRYGLRRVRHCRGGGVAGLAAFLPLGSSAGGSATART
jgi:hypothetical protein